MLISRRNTTVGQVNRSETFLNEYEQDVLDLNSNVDNFLTIYKYEVVVYKFMNSFFKITFIPCYIFHALFIYTLIKTHKAEQNVSSNRILNILLYKIIFIFQ